jgi:hypothetical protein
MREDIGRWFCFFHALSYFVLVFWLTFFNAFHLISALISVSCCYHHEEKRLVNSITFFVWICACIIDGSLDQVFEELS